MGPYGLGILCACLTALLWGVLAVALKVALNYIDLFTIIWFRFFFSFMALFLYRLWRAPKELKVLIRPPWLAVLGGVGLALNYYGYMKGVDYTSPSTAQILIQLGPLLLIVLGIFLFKERVNKAQILGFTLVSLGFVLFYEDQLQHLMTSKGLYNAGNLWVIFAAVTWAIYAMTQKKLVLQMRPQNINLVVYGLSALIFLPLNDWQALVNLPLDRWPLIIFLGLNTLVAYGALGEALLRAPAYQVSIIITLNPLITMAIMFFLSKSHVVWIRPEIIGLSGYLGALFVLLGAALVTFKARKKS